MSNNKQSSLYKDFVPFEQALELKELGFDIPCYKYIYIGDTGINVDHYLEVEPTKARNYNEDSLCVSQTTLSQAFRWFREKYGIFNPQILIFKTVVGKYGLQSHDEYDQVDGYFDTYEEAELACLRKLIEIVKEIKQ